MAPSIAVTLVYATDERCLLGRASGKLPWDIPEDRAHFWRTVGSGKAVRTVVAGRKTYEGLAEREVLPRFGCSDIFVLSRKWSPVVVGAWRTGVVQSLEELARRVSVGGTVFVIGGAETFRAFCEPNPHFHVARIVRTDVYGLHDSRAGDVYLPACLMNPGDLGLRTVAHAAVAGGSHAFTTFESPSHRAHTKIILLNGPPGCGKDTAADLIAKDFGAIKLEFKDSLHREVCAHFGLNYAEWIRDYDDRELKETPRADLGGRTPRQAMIYVSEELLKPKFGDACFALRTLDRMRRDALHVVSDCGFQSEVDTMVRSDFDVLVIKMRREGCSFAGDSRDYVDGVACGPQCAGGIRQTAFDNSGSLDMLHGFLKGAVGVWDGLTQA